MAKACVNFMSSVSSAVMALHGKFGEFSKIIY